MGLPPWPAGGLVLLYHRVAELASNPQGLAVSPARFADHLDVLREHGAPMPLEALVHGAREAPLPPGAVAVTFDDGYADNLHDAAPLLQRAGVPATIFVSTGTLDGPREFWWEELERVLLGPGTLPQRLRLSIGGDVAEWDLAGALEFTVRDCAQHASWTVDRPDDPTPRHRAYRDLCRDLRRVAGDLRARALDELWAQAGTARVARDTHRALTAAEVHALAGLERITIGSHTASHPSLPSLGPEAQRDEIGGARARLEAITGAPVTSFAYPFGGSADRSAATAKIVRDEGITIACTTQPGTVRPGTSPHAVPRVIVRDWTRDEFLRRWREWTAA